MMRHSVVLKIFMAKSSCKVWRFYTFCQESSQDRSRSSRRWISPLPFSTRFDLSRPFPDSIQRFTRFFRQIISTLADPETQTENLFLPRRQGRKELPGLFRHVHIDRSLRGRHGLLVFDKIAKMAVIFLTDGRLQRDRFFRQFQRPPGSFPADIPSCWRSPRDWGPVPVRGRETWRF